MTSINNCGYLRNGKGELIHREIFKNHYGDIPSNWVIHHKDENKLNNDLSNLELLSDSEHKKIHATLNNPMRKSEGRDKNALKQTNTGVLHLGTYKDKGYLKGYRWRYNDKVNNIKFTSCSLGKLLQKLEDNNINLYILDDSKWEETLNKEGLIAT